MQEKKGQKNKGWLLDARVQSKVVPVDGRWEVSLVFIDTKDPKHVLVQRIGDYRSERLANIYARYMQQTAAKDIRGTQKVNKDAYNSNNN